MSNYAKIKKFSIENGVGIRTSVFFSGCPFNCKNCFNKDIQDFNVGKPCGMDMYNEIAGSMNEHIRGLSILGGSPLCDQNCEDTFTLVKMFKKDFPSKDIWVYTGFTWEQIWLHNDFYSQCRQAILQEIDVLVDGRFIEEEKDLTLKWRGSKNQRVISVQQSLAQKRVVLYDE